MTTYGTIDGAQLVRGKRQELVGTDGTRFTGINMGLSVGGGITRVEFESVEGDVATTTKRRFFSSLTQLSTPRPRPVLGQVTWLRAARRPTTHR